MRKRDFRPVIIAACLTAAMLLMPVRDKRPERELPPQDTLYCIAPSELHIDLVLKEAEDLGVFIVAEKGEAVLDSLLTGRIDLAVVSDTMPLPHGVIASRPFLQETVWVLRDTETEALRKINDWMSEISATRAYKNLEKGKLDRLIAISRYDSVIQKHARNIGWDWRLIAAVIYNESRFHNEANSGKGAQGLMQILSSKYTAEEMSDPDRNLEIGTKYLKKLDRMLSKSIKDTHERLKFVLASYNFGEGKIQRLMDQAKQQGLDPARWDDVSSLLPEGHHTVSYVEKVLDTYRDYSRLYPANRP